jgi:hypothetical protein
VNVTGVMVGVRRIGWPESCDGPHKVQKRENSLDSPFMGGSGLARSMQSPHEEREIACGGLYQQLLVDIEVKKAKSPAAVGEGNLSRRFR